MVPWAQPNPQPKWHLKRFSRLCTVHSRVSVYFTMDRPLPSKLPLRMGIWTPSNTWLLGLSVPTIQTASWLDQPFLHSSPTTECPYFIMVCPFVPQNCPLPWVDLDSHLIHGFLDPPESSIKMASWSVNRFLQGSLLWQTNQQTTLLGR